MSWIWPKIYMQILTRYFVCLLISVVNFVGERMNTALFVWQIKRAAFNKRKVETTKDFSMNITELSLAYKWWTIWKYNRMKPANNGTTRYRNFFHRRQVPFHRVTWSLDPSECKTFPLNTGFHYDQVSCKTGFTAFQNRITVFVIVC